MSFRALTQYWITSGRGLKANAAPDNLVEPTMKNIFVGNLAFNTSEEDVRQLVFIIERSTTRPSSHTAVPAIL